ncbi:MAG: hypothetical protein ACREN5_12030, partial [Gemmatimonadales bacterium]
AATRATAAAAMTGGLHQSANRRGRRGMKLLLSGVIPGIETAFGPGCDAKYQSVFMPVAALPARGFGLRALFLE